MHARVTTVEGSPDNVEMGIKSFNEAVLPAARGMAGFQGALLLVDRQAGKAVGISLWDSQENLAASEQQISQVREQIVQELGANQPTSIEAYEVAVNAIG